MTSDHKRKSLLHLTGSIDRRGDRLLSAALERAFRHVEQVSADDLTHGFHVYPARMHPGIARSLIADLAEPDTLVLDPFCGSGTVLVESMVGGLAAIGVDLNPLALRISEVRCAIRSVRQRRIFEQRLRQVGDASLRRVRQRIPSRAAIPVSEARWYDPHVLRELAGLWQEIRAVTARIDRRMLEVVFSAILVKVSRQRADTSAEVVDTRLRPGFTSELFLAKGLELGDRWRALYEVVPAHVPRPRLVAGDARQLVRLAGGSRPDLIVSSPPYGGTYDYVEHHARRWAWLGIDPEPLRRGEIGARRRLSRPTDGAVLWQRELADVLVALATVLAEDGRCVLLMGDAEVGGSRLSADVQLEHLAPTAGLRVVAVASQKRPDWRGKAPRHEHLVALQRG